MSNVKNTIVLNANNCTISTEFPVWVAFATERMPRSMKRVGFEGEYEIVVKPGVLGSGSDLRDDIRGTRDFERLALIALEGLWDAFGDLEL